MRDFCAEFLVPSYALSNTNLRKRGFVWYDSCAFIMAGMRPVEFYSEVLSYQNFFSNGPLYNMIRFEGLGILLTIRYCVDLYRYDVLTLWPQR